VKIKLHQNVEGHVAGDEIEVPEDRAEWYVTNGYASVEDAEKQAQWSNQMGTTPDKELTSPGVREAQDAREAKSAETTDQGATARRSSKSK
jgi:hypothetical protein